MAALKAYPPSSPQRAPSKTASSRSTSQRNRADGRHAIPLPRVHGARRAPKARTSSAKPSCSRTSCGGKAELKSSRQALKSDLLVDQGIIAELLRRHVDNISRGSGHSGTGQHWRRLFLPLHLSAVHPDRSGADEKRHPADAFEAGAALWSWYFCGPCFQRGRRARQQRALHPPYDAQLSEPPKAPKPASGQLSPALV